MRKNALVLLVLGLILSGLTACNGEGSADNGSTTTSTLPQEPQQPLAVHDPIAYTVFTASELQAGMLRLPLYGDDRFCVKMGEVILNPISSTPGEIAIEVGFDSAFQGINIYYFTVPGVAVKLYKKQADDLQFLSPSDSQAVRQVSNLQYEIDLGTPAGGNIGEFFPSGPRTTVGTLILAGINPQSKIKFIFSSY